MFDIMFIYTNKKFFNNAFSTIHEKHLPSGKIISQKGAIENERAYQSEF